MHFVLSISICSLLFSSSFWAFLLFSSSLCNFSFSSFKSTYIFSISAFPLSANVVLSILCIVSFTSLHTTYFSDISFNSRFFLSQNNYIFSFISTSKFSIIILCSFIIASMLLLKLSTPCSLIILAV